MSIRRIFGSRMSPKRNMKNSKNRVNWTIQVGIRVTSRHVVNGAQIVAMVVENWARLPMAHAISVVNTRMALFEHPHWSVFLFKNHY